jgi:hypothetical protein
LRSRQVLSVLEQKDEMAARMEAVTRLTVQVRYGGSTGRGTGLS